MERVRLSYRGSAMQQGLVFLTHTIIALSVDSIASVTKSIRDYRIEPDPMIVELDRADILSIQGFRILGPL